MISSFPISWLVVSIGLFSLWLLWVIRAANWAVLKNDTTAQHVFFGSILALCCLWQIRGGIKPGLDVHFVGVTAAVLIMGWPLGIMAVLGAFVCSMGLGWMPWSEFGLQGLIQIALPAAVSWCGYQIIQRYFPPNPFIYLILCAFFVAGLSMCAIVIAKTIVFWLADVYSFDVIYHNYMRYTVLLMFPEAFLNGAIVGTFFFISPHWIATFDEDVFFHDDDNEPPHS